MREPAGHPAALGPEVGDALKVVAYFDALVDSGVGLDGLLRAAAALSGTNAGAQWHGRTRRYDPNGRRLAPADDPVRSPDRVGRTAHVWLERDGTGHVNDAMIVERLGRAVDLLDHRGAPESALDIVLDPERNAAERATALARLKVDPGQKIRLIATGLDEQAPSGPSTVVPTRYGMLRATLETPARAVPVSHAGVGAWVLSKRAAQSWAGAAVAYRLTEPENPVLDATDLGVLVPFLAAHDPEVPHDDVAALRRHDDRTAAILRTLVETDSIRAAAARLGMHHSTVQARHEALTLELGYDPRTPLGRMRYIVAAVLLRLSDPGARGQA